MGGVERPCVSDAMLEAEERETGHQCPRREWPDDDSPLVAHLVFLGARQETAHLFDWGFRIAYGEAPRDFQRRMFTRILAAFGDKAVRDHFYPKSQEG